MRFNFCELLLDSQVPYRNGKDGDYVSLVPLAPSPHAPKLLKSPETIGDLKGMKHLTHQILIEVPGKKPL
jgi:hypothetical protein